MTICQDNITNKMLKNFKKGMSNRVDVVKRRVVEEGLTNEEK